MELDVEDVAGKPCPRRGRRTDDGLTAVFKNVDAARANKKIHNLHAKSSVSHISLKSPPIRVIFGAVGSGMLPAGAGSFCELFWWCL